MWIFDIMSQNHFNLKKTGTYICVSTTFPCILPGSHFGMLDTTRIASSINSVSSVSPPRPSENGTFEA